MAGKSRPVKKSGTEAAADGWEIKRIKEEIVMPLKKDSSQDTISENIGELREAGYLARQAAVIVYDKAGKSRKKPKSKTHGRKRRTGNTRGRKSKARRSKSCKKMRRRKAMG